ncbi:class I SAM-dependent methyltransferase [Nocardia sp. NPDC059240]|uniref:class I SAM-dependent methyltransferase n=1 Tax=Nocardia sp. NPDC059240 TaxID=3346786 RepID=UPI0036B19322
MDRQTIYWYEEFATNYIARNDSFEAFRGLEQDLLKFVGRLRDGAVVVDLGSGSGRDARLISAAGHTVIAVDRSRPLLERCLVSASPEHRIIGVNADLVALPFAPGSIDGIWACGSLLHLPHSEIPDVLARCYEMLRPGGPMGLSMKEGSGSERRSDGRLFTYTNKAELCGWLSQIGYCRITIDGPSRNQWLLAVAVKPEAG